MTFYISNGIVLCLAIKDILLDIWLVGGFGGYDNVSVLSARVHCTLCSALHTVQCTVHCALHSMGGARTRPYADIWKPTLYHFGTIRLESTFEYSCIKAEELIYEMGLPLSGLFQLLRNSTLPKTSKGPCHARK